jgi:hypothetical protein
LSKSTIPAALDDTILHVLHGDNGNWASHTNIRCIFQLLATWYESRDHPVTILLLHQKGKFYPFLSFLVPRASLDDPIKNNTSNHHVILPGMMLNKQHVHVVLMYNSVILVQQQEDGKVRIARTAKNCWIYHILAIPIFVRGFSFNLSQTIAKIWNGFAISTLDTFH